MLSLENLEIRKAVRTDAQNIIDHIRLISGESEYHTFTSQEFELSENEQIRIIDSINLTNNSLMLVCYLDNVLVGVLTLNGGKRSRTNHSGMLGITIKEEYCGLGLGHRLLEYMNDWITRGTNISKVNLVVHQDNVKAIKFYENHNYTNEGRSSRYFKNNEQYYDGIYMGKSY
jgi:ribosomal protein S18 acetylase RimI-like enzyme